MINKISETEEILARLVKEGKTKTIDANDYAKASERINTEMEAVRREFKQKDNDSRKYASLVTLTS
jgi:hypothetical protein